MNRFTENEPKKRIDPFSWTCVDGLGRVLSCEGDVRPAREDRFTVLFYWPCHGFWPQIRYARNIATRWNAADEETRQAARNDYHHPLWDTPCEALNSWYWDESIFGYYNTYDPYVIRKHAELLADAGVDMIVFDCCVGLRTTASYHTIFQGFSAARRDGVNAPKVGFILPMGNAPQDHDFLITLYNEIYSKGLYEDCWFYLEDENGIQKPLIFAWKDNLDPNDPYESEIRDFFTYRKMDAYSWRNGDEWDIIATKDVDAAQFKNGTLDVVGDKEQILCGWLNPYPQTKYWYVDDGKLILDNIPVGVAQNVDMKRYAPTPMNGNNVAGRNYTYGEYSYTYKKQDKMVTVTPDMEDAVLYGLNFQQQWDYALDADPRFVFITGWNEWTVGRYEEFCGVLNSFPDQFNEEFSRDCEPSKGKLKDHYYYQLAENIRRFKGVSVCPPKRVQKTIDITGDLSSWDEIDSFDHYVGSTKRRAFNGCIDLFYQCDTMRNDIARAKVAYDDTDIFFYVETVANLTPETDSAWMRLFICTDITGTQPNWEGFNYIVNRTTGMLERSVGGWNWEEVGTIQYNVKGRVLQMVIPRAMLNLADKLPDFHFKWSDNMQEDGNIMDFYVNGDVAPGGRFMFHFSGLK